MKQEQVVLEIFGKIRNFKNEEIVARAKQLSLWVD